MKKRKKQNLGGGPEEGLAPGVVQEKGTGERAEKRGDKKTRSRWGKKVPDHPKRLS